jgi:hypothetical protein
MAAGLGSAGRRGIVIERGPTGARGATPEHAPSDRNQPVGSSCSRVPIAPGVQLRRRRPSLFSVVSPSKSVAVSTSSPRSTSSKVFTLMTAYCVPSIVHVAIGITPQVRQMWKSAVLVPNRYRFTWAASSIWRSKRPFGWEVQTALCFVHSAQLQARTGIACPDCGQSSLTRGSTMAACVNLSIGDRTVHDALLGRWLDHCGDITVDCLSGQAPRSDAHDVYSSPD